MVSLADVVLTRAMLVTRPFVLSNGMSARLVPAAAGAVPYRVNLDVRFERAGFDPLPQRDFGWDAYAMTRPPGRV